MAARSQNASAVVHFKSGAIDVQCPALRFNSPGIIDDSTGMIAAQTIDGIAKVQTIALAFDQSFVVKFSLKTNRIGNPQTSRGATVTFTADDS